MKFPNQCCRFVMNLLMAFLVVVISWSCCASMISSSLKLLPCLSQSVSCNMELMNVNFPFLLMVFYLFTHSPFQNSLIDDYKTIQSQIGSIHRYINFFQFLVEVLIISPTTNKQTLRTDVAMNPPTTNEQMDTYLNQSKALLHMVECFIGNRNTIEKYTEILSSMTLCLFSIAPQQIISFYNFLLRHWPRGYSEKVGFFFFYHCVDNRNNPVRGKSTFVISSTISHSLFEGHCTTAFQENLPRVAGQSSGDQ